MTDERDKIAVVGAGLIGRKHLELVQAHAEVFAVVDPSPAAKALAQESGARWYGELSHCLSDGRPDGVIVASPNALHLEHGTACLNARIPVLIEKPLADTSKAARQLAALSEETGTPLLVGHHRRHSAVIRSAKSVIESGRLGRIVAVNALFWLHKPDGYFEIGWRRGKGGGPAYINLIHDIDLLQHLCGRITSVKAVESSSVRGFEVEDTAAAVLTFASGALGTVSISDTASAPWSWELTAGENPAYPRTDQSCYLIAGTEGSLSVPDLTVWAHEGERSWWAPITRDHIEVTAVDPVEAQFLHFLDVVRGKAAPLVTAVEGAQNIDVIEALKSAAAANNSVHVG